MNKKNLKRKGEKGITLVALIITIIVLLILAVVAIRAIEGDGIIKYAKNARDNYEKAQENELILLQGYIDSIEQNLPITWETEGDLAVGSTVKASNGEEFYVISSDNSTTVTLLAKHNLNADGSAQDTSDAYKCAFSASNYWTAETADNLNNTTSANATAATAVNKAKAYGAKLGVTGRLMTKSDLTTFDFVDSTSTTATRIALKSNAYFICSSNYWLADATGTSVLLNDVWGINTNEQATNEISYDFPNAYGIRVLLEIPRAKINIK